MRLILAFFILISSLQAASSQADGLADSIAGHLQAVEIGNQENDLRLMQEMSNLLTILENYEDAAMYNQRIAQLSRTRDSYYNVALQSLLGALHYFDPKELPFIFPVELDSRARRPASGLSELERAEKRRTLLRRAVIESDTALQMDQDFRAGYLAKGTALTLLGAFDAADSNLIKQALTCLSEGIKHCPLPKMTTDFLVAQGLVAALQGNLAGATRYWEQAKSIGSYLAVRNLDILQKKPVSTQILPGPAPIAGVEQIEWYSLEEFLSNPSFDQEVSVPVIDTATAGFRCGVKQKLQSRILFHSKEHGDYALVQETGPGYRGNSLRGVNLSSKADNVQEAYGVAKRNFALGDGYVWVYPEVNLYFKFNNKSDLLSWGVYRISKK